MSSIPVDVIMLANCQTDELYKMTNEAIKSFKDINNLIWIEGNENLKDERISCYQNKPFNFNGSLRQAENYLNPKNKAVFMVNNDVIAELNCIEILLEHLSRWDSVSPMCPIRHKGFTGVKEGYLRAHEVSGWAIMFNKKILKKLSFKKLFPFELKFWRQDQYYADIIKVNNFKHALIGDAKLLHLESRTHEYLPNKKEYTTGMLSVYDKIKKYDRSNL